MCFSNRYLRAVAAIVTLARVLQKPVALWMGICCHHLARSPSYRTSFSFPSHFSMSAPTIMTHDKWMWDPSLNHVNPARSSIVALPDLLTQVPFLPRGPPHIDFILALAPLESEPQIGASELVLPRFLLRDRV